MSHRILNVSICSLAAALLLSAAPGVAQTPRPDPGYQAKAEEYAKVRKAFDEELGAYWKSIAEKRRARNAKRRNRETVELDDYVLTHPPVYKGPPRPVDPSAPDKPPPNEPKRPEIPVVADFLKVAFEQYGFVPERPSELEFKQLYAKAAAAAGLTKEQVVRIYAFETGGNGTYDLQAGFEYKRPNARAISPAIGYNQLLTTNSVELIAEQGREILHELTQKAAQMSGAQRKALDHKIAVLKQMVAVARSVPDQWTEHEKLGNTPQGWALHAMVLDVDVGPLLQTHKLLTSLSFAKAKGLGRALTAAELEMMNLTGDSTGLDMVTMPQALREQVPTSNFFQRSGYERNPVAIRHNTVAKLLAVTDSRMDSNSLLPGAKELAGAF